MKKSTRRLWGYSCLLITMALGCFILLKAFQDNVVFFLSPAELKAQESKFLKKKMRLGGLVQPKSLHKDSDGLTHQFWIYDYQHAYKVRFRGIPPALFREGKGIIAEGKLEEDGTFYASELLAKHDENYMPPTIDKQLSPPSSTGL